MNGYLIARFDMTDPERAPAEYKKYVEAAAPAYAEFNARALVRGGASHPVEGQGRVRNVLVEFESVADAYAFYHCKAYEAARPIRQSVAEGEMIVIEGAIKPRPAQDGKKAYWIARQDITDEQTYKRYLEGTASVFKRHEALFLVRNGPHQAMEGQARARNVVIEFPSLKEAMACWEDPDYQAAAEYRRQAAVGEIVIAEGVE